jgi:UV DNA damage endonuclease
MKLGRREALRKLAGICRSNAEALMAALEFCANKGIGCFRINSQILPLKSHPNLRYRVEELPRGREIRERFEQCGDYVREHGLRTTFHPDQFVVLNSPRTDVLRKSVEELDYQAEVAEWVGADVINVHAGGGYGDKQKALFGFRRSLTILPVRVRERLTLENDDKIFTPSDLLTICRSERIPLVYDVHHHRCNPDELGEEEATQEALATWEREPLFHVSTPLEGWKRARPHRHHDFIDLRDFPRCWDDLSITVEVEAKAKELAVKRLAAALRRRAARNRVGGRRQSRTV